MSIKDEMMAGIELASLMEKRMKNGDFKLPTNSEEAKEMLLEKAKLLKDVGDYNKEGNGMVIIKSPTNPELLAEILALVYFIYKEEKQ